MDLQTALLSIGVCALSAVVVYLISVFGMKEKTYEEAIEEQRKRNQEAAQISKVEKPKKEKKFKKQGKRAKETRNSEEETEHPATNHVNDHVEFKTETEIIPMEPEPESKPPKAKKKFKAPKSILLNKQEVGPISAEPLASNDDDNDSVDVSPPAFVPMDEVKRRQSLDIGQKKLASLIQLSQAAPVQEPIITEIKAPVEVKSQPEVKVQSEVKIEKKPEETSKKSKKTRSESFESADGELSFKKLMGAIKKVTLVDEESQSLIDLLLNKQQGGPEWTKKNDPVAALKKQLAEREAALETEQKTSLLANNKLKEVRQEFSQEKVRASTAERSLRQELQTLHSRMQATVEQQAKTQQTQAKSNEEQAMSIQILNEEKGALQQQVKLLDVDLQKWAARERDVQRELEERFQASLAKEKEHLSIQLQSKESHLQQVLAAQQKGDFQLSQAITEIKQQLQESQAQCVSLSQELEGERSSIRQRLEEKEMTLRKQDEDLQRINRMAEEERLKLQGHTDLLQGQLKNATNQLQDYDRQLALGREEAEALQQQLAGAQQEWQSMQVLGNQAARQEQEKDLLNVKLAEREETLKQVQGELENVNKEIQSQKSKNNELRERNWKAMDALSALEKSSKDREESLNKELAQERQAHLDAQQKLQEQSQSLQNQTPDPSVLRDQLLRLQEEDRVCLQRVLPDVQVDGSLEHSTWLEQFAEQVRERLSSFGTFEEENKSLAVQVIHYQTVLSDTESMLKKLQSGVESQESMWMQRLTSQEALTQKVLEEKSSLESQLQQLQGIEEATAEMQARLKELQAKLQGEESEKKVLEGKADEALQKCVGLTSELEAKNQELERLRQEQEAQSRVTVQLEGLQKDLDKERKITKELGSQAVKLNSLVKIGQDALKAEQELVKQLQVQLTTTTSNGNNNNNINNNKIPAANGTAVETEGASGKK